MWTNKNDIQKRLDSFLSSHHEATSEHRECDFCSTRRKLFLLAVLNHAPATRKASVPLKRKSVNYVSDLSQEESDEISESSEDEKRRIETVTLNESRLWLWKSVDTRERVSEDS